MNTILSFVSSKKVMTTFLLLISISFYAQIVVTDVFPTRVTKSSVVTIIGDASSGFTNSTSVYVYGISTGSVEATPDGSELSFEITLDGTADISSELKIGGQKVYIGSYDPAYPNVNKVTIDYIGSKLKRNDVADTHSQSFKLVTDIITNWNYNGQGYWRYSTNYTYGTSSTYPDDSHELLAFKYDGVYYSTGVADNILDGIIGLSYNDEVFKAYSTNGITGTINNGANFIATGDMVDGASNEGTTISSPYISDLTVFQVMIDGINGLDLGTGVTNYNKSASIRFFSGNGQVGAISDGVPDLIITQIADSGSWDIYYYADERGNVVGRPIKMYLKNNTNNLGRWKLDLYSLPSGADINTANPQSRTFGSNETRLIKIVAFNLEDFDILTSADIDAVNNINSVAGGSADMAFIAYNQSAFDIKVPIAEPILPQFVCKADGTTSVTFTVNAGIEDGSGGMMDPPTGDVDLELKYKWRKYNSAISGAINEDYTITGVGLGDLATYKIEISNAKGGTIILPVKLSEGGTPYYWNGSGWSSPYGAVVEKERGLVYTGDYTITDDLVGCDCRVTSGSDVVIPEGSKMVLYNELTVEPEITEVKQLDEFGNVVKDEFGNDVIIVNYVPEGTFTLEDNASLVQINDVDVINFGKIKAKRALDASEINQYDYVYWASPVKDFNVSGLYSSRTYQWEVNAPTNDSGIGNWVNASGEVMKTGEGYIARVANTQLGGFTTEFYGEPNNGLINVDVYKSNEPYLTTMSNNHSSWNLLGNPYPSAIDAEKFLNENTNIEGRVDIWTHDTGLFAVTGATDAFYNNYGVNYGNQYITFNSTGTSTPDPSNTFDGKIASGQAFFVRVDNGSSSTSSVEFNNTMRHNNIVAYDNAQFHRNGADDTGVAVEKQLVWLSLANEENHAMSTLIGYVDGATNEKDRLYDAYTNNEGFNLYSLISDEEKLVIQGLPLPFKDTNTVPLGMELLNSGIYTISIGNVKGSLFEAQEQAIYLEDMYSGVIHDLRASPYSFTGEAGEFNDRFILRYTNIDATLSISDVAASNTFIYVKNDMLNVKSDSNIRDIKVYDINGRQVIAYTFNGQRNNVSENFQFSKGVYVVSITLEGNAVVTKKIIN